MNQTMSQTNQTIVDARDLAHRYARHVARRDGDLLSSCDVTSLADRALVRAFRRWDGSRSSSFRTYARKWIAGAVVEAVREELAQRRTMEVHEERPPPARPPTQERVLSALDLLDRLPVDEAEAVWRYVVTGSYTDVGAALGCHRSSAYRARERGLTRLRGYLSGSTGEVGT